MAKKKNIKKAQNGIEGTMGGLTDKGFNFNPAWGGAWENGGWMDKYEYGGSIIQPPMAGANQTVSMYQKGGKKQKLNTPENWERAIRDVEHEIGNPSGWTMDSYNKLQNKLNEYKAWRENTPEGKAVIDYHNEPNEYVVPLPPHLKNNKLPQLVNRQTFVDNTYVKPIPAPYRTKGKEFAMGGSLPGSVGFTYARIGAPSNGPHAKKTLASAQNGQEMSFYQQGLDFTPKSISRNGGWLDKFEEGGEIVKDNEGYWNPQNWGKVVEIDSNNITMQGVNQPLLGIGADGQRIVMQPGEDYQFNEGPVTEYPIAQNGTKQNIITSNSNKPKLILSTPTRADSLAIYNQNNKVLNYYRNNPEYKKIYETEGNIINDIGNKNRIAREKVAEKLKEHELTVLPKAAAVMPMKDYYNKLDDNRYFQRETSVNTLNTDAPFQLFDERINPTKFYTFHNVANSNKSNVRGDIVELFGYDPILVKPVDLLTPAERQERIRKYGNKSGIQNAFLNMVDSPSNPTKNGIGYKRQISELPKKNPPGFMPEFNQPSIKVPQAPTADVVPRTIELAPQEKTKWSFTYPTGKYLEDKTIYFPDKASWKVFVEQQRGTSSQEGKDYGTATGYFKNGGVAVNKADEYPLEKLDNLLNFTNYNKKAKSGGWLDKYK